MNDFDAPLHVPWVLVRAKVEDFEQTMREAIAIGRDQLTLIFDDFYLWVRPHLRGEDDDSVHGVAPGNQRHDFSRVVWRAYHANTRLPGLSTLGTSHGVNINHAAFTSHICEIIDSAWGGPDRKLTDNEQRASEAARRIVININIEVQRV